MLKEYGDYCNTHSCLKCTKDCIHKGDGRMDCPKYTCDRADEGLMRCDECAFLRQFIRDVYGEMVEVGVFKNGGG